MTQEMPSVAPRELQTLSPTLLCRPTSTPSQQPSEEMVMTYEDEMEIGFESYTLAMDDREEDIL